MSEENKCASVTTADVIGIIKDYKITTTSNVALSTTANVTAIQKMAESYKMSHSKRGAAVIFNHYRFATGKAERRGTTKDCEAFNLVLRQLGFDVTTYTDLNYCELFGKITDLAKMDHTDSDCLLIAVLTHGGSGVITARDRSYSPHRLWKPFAGDRCPTLAGKPKLFFIQACRGEQLDDGVTLVEEDASGEEKTYTIPVMADILVMYSSYEGYYSFREERYGSWFIQCICNALMEYAKDKDLMTILTLANRTMAVDWQSRHTDPMFDAKKQIGTIVSTLTRLVYFYEQENK